MKARSAAFLALRIGLTAGLLLLAIFMIDFSDRTIFHLSSGGSVETTGSWRESDTQVFIRSAQVGDLVLNKQDIVRREDRPGIISVVKRVRPWPAILVIPALAILYISQAARWRLLLKANEFEVPLGRAIRVTWSGAFFSQILPGSVGGDVAKALIVAQGEARKAAVFGTVILDRLVGLVTVVAIAAVAILPVIGREEMWPAIWLVAGAIVAGAVGAALYYSPLLRRWPAARRLKDRLPFRKSLEEVDDVLKTMHHAPRTILGAVGLSVIGQAATILAIFALSESIGGGVGVGDFFLIEPIIFLAAAMPVSVGGWGVEQVAYAHLFGMAGMATNTAVALSVLYKICVLAISLPGGLLFAAGATRRK